MSFLSLYTAEGDLNPALRARMHGRSGIYVVRVKRHRSVLYIGESHTGRAWKTLLRHFHGTESFRGRGEWVCDLGCALTRLEVAFYKTHPRSCLVREAAFAKRLKPTYARGTRVAKSPF